MNSLDWSVNWREYAFKFRAPYGLPQEGSPRIELSVENPNESSLSASGHFKLRREGYCDDDLARDFDVIVISNIEINEGHSRRGMGTAIIRSLAAKFPNALFVGENPNSEADAWHVDRLEIEFPTRMVKIVDRVETRVTPGVEVDSSELWDPVHEAIRRGGGVP